AFHESYPHCQLPCAEQLEKVIKREGPEYIAAFICEPIIGASGGAIVPPPYYYQRIKQLCDHYGILFIVDEVMTGMGRTGRNFAINHWGVIPDLIALGKGMSAGYAPIAATIVSERIIDVISNGSGAIMAGHTYSAHPQSAAAALAVLDIIEKNQLIQKVAEKGNMLMRELKKIKEAHPIVGDVRGKGFLCGIEFGDFEQKGLSERLIEKAFSLGLLLYPAMGGSDYYGGEGVLVAPPFTLQQEDMNVLLQRLDQALSLLEEDLKHG
ncbi:MAG TPA: aspartate aminotransferase family protein, partial [Paenibacillaceae bacterium]|nr:aspartate aminotransferase family protein [Paenibacillaceae bacterium]